MLAWAGLGWAAWAGLGWAGLGWAVGPVAGPRDAQYCSTVQVVPRVLGWVYWVLLSAPHTSHHCSADTPPECRDGRRNGGPMNQGIL